ncbi:MAG TPA: hypothetical protein VIL31_13200 [Cyclobacteriaceae bacterium]|jgi:hypothetical protein
MKKLEDIPRKKIFDVPEGYFDQLPGRIQARIAAESRDRSPSWLWGGAVRYALPILIAGAIFAGWWLKKAPEDPEAILASIETEQLVTYLEEYGLVTEDLIPYGDLTTEDVAAIENEVYETTFDEDELEMLLDEFTLDINDTLKQ